MPLRGFAVKLSPVYCKYTILFTLLLFASRILLTRHCQHSTQCSCRFVQEYLPLIESIKKSCPLQCICTILSHSLHPLETQVVIVSLRLHDQPFVTQSSPSGLSFQLIEIQRAITSTPDKSNTSRNLKIIIPICVAVLLVMLIIAVLHSQKLIPSIFPCIKGPIPLGPKRMQLRKTVVQ